MATPSMTGGRYVGMAPLEREGGHCMLLDTMFCDFFFRDVDLELANSMIDKEQIQFPRAQ